MRGASAGAGGAWAGAGGAWAAAGCACDATASIKPKVSPIFLEFVVDPRFPTTYGLLEGSRTSKCGCGAKRRERGAFMRAAHGIDQTYRRCGAVSDDGVMGTAV